MGGWDHGLGRHGGSWLTRECGRAKPTHAHGTSHHHPRGTEPRTPRALHASPIGALRNPARRMPKQQQDATPTPKVLRLTGFRGKIVS
ncbi:hypothetical protein HMPREF9058_1398 [Actinomyces sp. oral taxon 175 str. F0384]|nr:hypothetical protein HMPREF9058_1398 [Actinomyces sp. oral taxon 175 str. F0384]